MTPPDLPYDINLLDNGSVVTGYGEYLGTWGTDESDALYQFTPDGGSRPLFTEPFIRFLCDKIKDWHGPD